jgi:hypothetical protein
MRSKREISDGVTMIRLTNIARVVTVAAALAAVWAVPATARAQKQSPARPVVVAAQDNAATQPYEISQLLVVVGGKDGNVTTRQSTGQSTGTASSEPVAQENVAKVNANAVSLSAWAKQISYTGK